MVVTPKLSLDLDLYEKVVMFNALFDQTYLETIIEHVKPSYFKDKDIKKVFSVLSSFYEQYQKVPNTTELKAHLVSEEDKQSLKNVVLSFNSIDQKYDKDVLISNTERFLKEKAVLSTVLSTSIDVNSGEIDSTAILKNFEKACGISLIDNLGFDYFENLDEHIVELQKTFKTISSGWKWLDKHLAGGFQAEGKALYVFFGQTNVGKSIFLGQMATNILEQGKTVVLISLEMGEQVYAKRISSSLSRIPSNDLTKHIDPLKSKINQYKLKNKDSKLIIKEFPPKGVTVLGIKNYLEKLVKNGIKPDVVILDYLNLIAPAKNGQNSYEAIKEISEGIRALSYKFECSFISATQQNRSGYGEEMPDLDTTSESMGLAHTVDAQMCIWTSEADFELGIIHLGIVKNRFGNRGIHTQLKIDYPTLSISELDDVVFSYTLKDSENTKKNSEKTTNTSQSTQEHSNISDILSSAEMFADDSDK